MFKIITKKEEGKFIIGFSLDIERIIFAFKNTSRKIASRLELLKIAIKVLKADPQTVSIEKLGRESRLLLTWQEKQALQKSEQKFAKIISGIGVIVLLSGILILNSFFPAPITKANDLCAVDAVLVMDISRTMADGGSPSKCEWTELKPIASSSTWFLNTKYDVTSDWCMNPSDQLPFDSYEYGTYKAPTYTPAKNSKIEDAKIAASSFLDNLDETTDQSALVSFNDIANLVKNLSNDHPTTKTAVNGLTPGATNATNIGDAIAQASNELDSKGANSEANKVIILLTDGKANKPNGPGSGEWPADVDYAISKAQEAASSSQKIFTIGLGNLADINQTMLQNIANISGGQYYYAPESANLTDIYNQIYNQISWEECQYSLITDLAVTKKIVDDNTPDENQNIVFTINVVNNGPDSASGVILNDLLSSGLTFVSASSTLGSYASSTGAWIIGDLNSGSSAVLEITAKTNAGAGGSTIVNTATIIGEETDSNTENNAASVSITVNLPPSEGGGDGQPSPRADLSVSKTVDDNTVDSGQTIIFTIGVINIGPDVAPGVILNDLLSSSLTFVSASSTLGAYASSTGAWLIGDLVKDAIATLEIRTIVQGQAGAIITNNATSDLTIDPSSGNNSASATVTINTPEGTPPPSGGGGGGGGGGISAYGLLSADAQKVDANKDGKIDVLDFNILMIHWGETGMGVGDFNGDGKVDTLDFGLLMLYWIV